MTYGVRLRVQGKFACFTRPEMKVERVSYDVMTPSAARGILEAIYWKPQIRWIIDEIHVLKPVRFQSIRRNEVGAKVSVASARKAMKTGAVGDLHLVIEESRQQRAATILTNVDYVICAHFSHAGKNGVSEPDGKHLDMFTRRARKGQCFHQPCLGAREFPADFSLIEPDAPMPQAGESEREGLGFGVPRDLGFMLWDIDHAGDHSSIFFRANLHHGVLHVPQPGSPEMLR